MPDVALYQPEIPQNTGTILRLAACLGFKVHIIEPCGFTFSNQSLKRAGMDYLELASSKRHTSWEAFESWRQEENLRLILLTTGTDCQYTAFEFQKDDIMLFGRESSGVPEYVHQSADARLRIPMVDGMRSLNLAVSVGIAIGEAFRQTDSFAAQQ